MTKISPMLEASLVDPNKPLPATPEGVARLETTLAALVQAPQPWPIGPLPDTVEAISGKTYVFGPNSIDLATLRLEFSDNEEATLYMNLQGRDMIWPIGLDGKYRVEPEGRGLRGYWADPQTFVFEIFEDGLSTIRLHFEADRVQFDGHGVKFEGQVENP
jgi:hypothetical protein